MTHYRGQPCTLMELIGPVSESSQLWEKLSVGLGFAGAEPGERFKAPEGGVRFTGEVCTVPDETEIILHIDEPTSGAVHLFVWAADEECLLSVRFYLYGEDAAEVVAREEPRWRSWMGKQFPIIQSLRKWDGQATAGNRDSFADQRRPRYGSEFFRRPPMHSSCFARES